MARIHSVLSLGALLGAAFSPLGQAQEPAAGPVQEELRALRQLIEQQSKQIDTLTAQVLKLGAELERRGAAVSSAPLTEQSNAPVTESAPAARVVAPAGSAPAAPAGGNVHIVVKGDSLDKIAKTYHTTIADLQKINRITDPKKLQIGQQIVLPPTATPPAAAEKKEGQ